MTRPARALSAAAGGPAVLSILAALVLLRIALPLAVLAAEGSALLPGFPRYDFEALPGDAYGYYSATRELLATPPRLGPALLLVLLALAVLVLLIRHGRSQPSRRAALLLAGVACVMVVAMALVLRMRYSGAPTIGWPLAWSVPLLPYRALGLPLDAEIAFGFGLALSLLANSVTVVSTYLLGLWVSGRREVGLLAAGWFGLWPLLVLLLGKTEHKGTWLSEMGLSLYTEPLSTALVVTGAALIARGQPSPVGHVLAGALLGFSVAVRLSNAVIVACAVLVLWLRGDRSAALRVAAAAATVIPVVVGYWPLGYAMLPADQFPDDPFSTSYAGPAWRDSIVWGGRAFVALVPLAVLGAFTVSRWAAALLWAWILSTAAVYTFYSFTPLHPRFLFVVLPALFVLWAAGAVSLVDRVRDRHGAYESFIRPP